MSTNLVTGDSEELSSTINVISLVDDTNLIIGDLVDLTATTNITTTVTGATTYIGIEEVLTATNNVIVTVNADELVFGLIELLTVTEAIQSNVNNAYLIAPIIYTTGSINIISNVYNSELNVALLLSSTCSVVSVVSGNIVPGAVEVAGGISITVSNILSELTIGIVEILSSTSLIGIDVNATTPINMQWLNISAFADSDVGDIRLLLGDWTSVASAKVSAVSTTLEFGIDEPLTATTNIISNVSDTGLVIGLISQLSSTLNIVSVVSTIDDLVELVTGVTIIQSIVSDAHLAFGAETGLSGITTINTTIGSSSITLGIETPLTSTAGPISTTSNAYFLIANYFGGSSSETESWGTLTLGVAEHFESGNVYIQSVVHNDGLIIGTIDLNVDYGIESNVDALLETQYSIKSSILIPSNVSAILTIGGVVELEYNLIIESSVSDADITLGVVEHLSHGGFLIESFVDGFIYTGQEYGIRSDVHSQSLVNEAELHIGDNSQLHSQVHAQSLFITPYLMKGISEDLSASINIGTTYGSLQIIVGLIEVLSSTIFSISIIDAIIDIGIDTELTATSNIDTASSGHILIGTTEVLSSTGIITSYTGLSNELYISIAINSSIVNTSIIPVSNIVIGSQESLSASITTGSSSNAEYIIGNHEPLIGSTNFSTNAFASLDVGYAEHLSGSVIFSINIYDLDPWGIVEELSSSISAKSNIDIFLNLGISNPLSSSLNIVQSITTSDLVIGLDTVLTATTSPWVESNSDTLWLEIEHNSIAVAQSSIPDVEITMGHLDNSISSTIVIGTTCTIEPMYLGESEILRASSLIQVIVATNLTLGSTNNYVESSIECISLVGTDTELNIDTIDRYVRRITADLQYWYDHFVVNHKGLNKHQFQFPARNKIYEQSFIELLFNDQYDKTSYRYMYREILDKQSWPDSIRTRMMLNPDTAHYYIADGDDPEEYNINLYDIQSHDIVMMDRLLVYRLEPQNSTLVGIDYDILDTALAKMIYIYLELKLTGVYSKYDNSAIFTTRVNSLETCYETYLTQNIFEHVSNKGT